MTRSFSWTAIPDGLCLQIVEAWLDEPGAWDSPADARRYLAGHAPVPDETLMSAGSPASVAHVVREALADSLGDYLGDAYQEALKEGLVQAIASRSPSAAVQLGALRAAPMRARMRRVLLRVLRAAGGAGDAAVDDGRPRHFFWAPTDGPTDGRSLHDHQRKVVADLEKAWNERGNELLGLVVMPTGAGKTITAVDWLMRGPLAEGRKVLWITHSVYLQEQTAHAFAERAPQMRKAGGRLGIRLIGGGRDRASATEIGHPDHDVVVATVQSFRGYRRLNLLQSWLAKHDVVVVFDEAHHVPAPSWRRLLQMARDETNDAVVGLTATPLRLSRPQTALLGRLFGATDDRLQSAVISEVNRDELVEKRVLSTATTITVPTGTDLMEGLRGTIKIDQFGDFPPRVLAQLENAAPRNKLIVQTYLEGPTDDRATSFGKTIVYAVNIAHAGSLVAAFAERGIRAEAVHTGQVPAENHTALDVFRDPHSGMDVLVNVQMLTEGVDVPNAMTVFLARPTLSEVLFHQMVGRCLRGPAMGGTEHAYVVDFLDIAGQFTTRRITFAAMELGEMGPEDDSASSDRCSLIPYDLDALVAMATAWGSAHSVAAGPRFSSIPLAYYLIGIDPPEGAGKAEAGERTLLVFDHDLDGYERIEDAIGEDGAESVAQGDLAEHFAGLRTPHPPAEALEDLRAHIEAFKEMPPRIPLAERDAVNPERIAAQAFAESGDRASALETVIDEVVRDHTLIIDRVWGGRSQFADDARRAWWAHVSPPGRTPLEQRRPRSVAPPPKSSWSYETDRDVFDLKQMVLDLLADPSLFATPPKPPRAVRWSPTPRAPWGEYDPATTEITINVLLNSEDLRDVEVLNFLLFHELLHHEQVVVLLMAADVQDAHDYAFYAREHSFPDHEVWDARLDAFFRERDYGPAIRHG